MAKTIDEAFRVFHSWLTPTTTESQAAKSHRASIEACLRNNFGLNRFFRTGSFGNGTSISGYSDIDYFAVIPSNEVPSGSTYFLQKVRNALDTRFPYTGVRVNSPAVSVPFGSNRSEHTEVVPAKYYSTIEGFDLYQIADGNGGWMTSSPDIHNAYVYVTDEKLSNKVKPLIRFLKAWKYYRNVPILSFYLELYVTRYAATQKTILFYWDVNRILKNLWDAQLPAIQDPMDISGYIYPCATASQKEDALSKLCTAHVRAENAFEAHDKSNVQDEFYWWRLLYDNKFPAYG